jgi:hypothetical protein
VSARDRLPLLYSPSGKVGRVYWRELPGGGYVALDVVEEPAHAGGRFVGTITVERRADLARREGCSPPVIAIARGHSPGSLLYQLLPLARSNPAIGSALLQRGMVTNDR